MGGFGKYPYATNRYTVKKTGRNAYTVTNWDTDEEFPMTAAEVSLLKSLDGNTAPEVAAHGMSHGEYRKALDMLRDGGFIRKSKKLEGFGEKKRALTVFREPKISNPLLYLINLAVTLLFIPLSVLGTVSVLHCGGISATSKTSLIAGIILGVIICTVIYPLSHLVSCAANGGRVFEIGLAGRFLMKRPYILLDTDNMGRFRRFSVDIAGIKWYFLFAGFFFLVSGGTGIAFVVGLICYISAMINLMFFGHNDIVRALSGAFDDDDLKEKINKTVRYKKSRKELRRDGSAGHISVFLAYLLFYSPFIPLALILFVTVFTVI